MRLPAILILAAALAGCGAQDGDADAQSSTNTPAAPVEYEPKTPVDRALVEIPPADRRSFQRALRCEIQRNQGDAIQITPEYIKDLQQRLKQDPSLADC